MATEYEKRKQSFGIKLTALLEYKGVKQSDIVRDLKLNSSTVSNWCQGVMIPRLDKMVQLAEYLDVPIGALVDEDKILMSCANDEANARDRYYIDVIIPHLENVILTDAELQEIVNFIEYIKSKKK